MGKTCAGTVQRGQVPGQVARYLAASSGALRHCYFWVASPPPTWRPPGHGGRVLWAVRGSRGGARCLGRRLPLGMICRHRYVSRPPSPNRACELSPHTALQRAAFLTRDYSLVRHRFSFRLCRFPSGNLLGSCLAERRSPGALRPVAGFPDLRLLWHLRRWAGLLGRLLTSSRSASHVHVTGLCEVV